MNLPAYDGRYAGAIDCDVHCTPATVERLYPYLSEYWRDFMSDCGHPSLEPNTYPPNSPLAARPGARDPKAPPGASLDLLRRQALDDTGVSHAILNCLYGVQLVRNDGWATAMAGAVNRWLVDDWLDQDARLRASIVVAPQDPVQAAAEIDRCATDRRFVQVLLVVRSEMPLGRPFYWPIYEAAAHHGLPVVIHAGGGTGNPTMPVGWTTYYIEDYASMAQAFQSTLISLVVEGVFARFPSLTVVLAEAGITWLPSLMWRFDKNWKGLRRDTPWVDRLPSEIIRQHVRLTLQPIDEPLEAHRLIETLEHIGSDEMLLFSTDYPHWQFDGLGAIPEGLDPGLAQKIMAENPRRTYARLNQTAGTETVS